MGLRWRPLSLSAQLLALLLGGLLLSHAAGVLLLSHDLGELHPLARKKSVDLYQRVFRSVEHLDAAAAAAVLAGASDGTGKFRMVAGPEPVPGSLDGDDAAAEAEVAAQLQAGLQCRAAELRVCVGDRCAAPLLLPADNRPTLPMVLQAQRKDGQWVQATLWPELRIRWWWPVSFWLQASLVPIFMAVALAARSVLRPGRALVAAAARVSRGERVAPLHIEGPQEMREILLAFNQMQQRLGHYLEDRTRMLAAISHDFRTPITALRLRAEMVEDSALRQPMVRTLDDMRTMVEETLRFARDEAYQEPTVDACVGRLLDEVVADQCAMGHDVVWAADSLEPGLESASRVRPVALKRAFANLLDNAVRYGFRASVRLHRLEGLLCIDIDDGGPGIAPEWLEAAFAPFSPFSRMPRGSGPQRAGGSGLGLSMARSCARAHGGDVVLLPRPDAPGARARITLPI